MPPTLGAQIESFRPESEGPVAVQVERGLVFPLCLRNFGIPGGSRPCHSPPQNAQDPLAPQFIAAADGLVGRLIEAASKAGRAAPDVIDRRGHRRPAYRALLVYAWLQAQRITSQLPSSERLAPWLPALTSWCHMLEADASGLTWGANGLPAAAGARAAAACWAALALHVAGITFARDDWTALAAGVFTKLTSGQQPSGALLLAGPADNPETHWYHELVLLHAAASYAAQSGDRAVAAAADRAAEYHLAETEPDHATGQPWGLFAFARNPRTRPLADQVLHGAMVHAAQSAGPVAESSAAPPPADGVSFILLADALYCMNVNSL